MTSKFKCPHCGETLRQSQYIEPLTGQNLYFCDTHDCYPTECVIGTQSMWQALIQTKEELKDCQHNYSVKSEQHERGYAYATKIIKDLESKLEIARKALEEIKKVCDGCRWCDSNLYDPTPSDGRRIAETTNKALEQIEHKK